MKKKIKKFFGILLIIIIVGTAVHFWHSSEMEALNDSLHEEMEREALMNERLTDIQEKLASSEEEKNSLISQLNDLLTNEKTVFDAAAIAGDIKKIGELATVEYRYTNVGTLDSEKRFALLDLKIPFSGKTAVVTMEGIIKVGVDTSKISIKADETTKTISVKLPQAEILSNELLEDTLHVYVEEGDITLNDSSAIRSAIKDNALKNAQDNSLFQQAYVRTADIIRLFIESIPGVKNTYSIVIK